MRRLAEDAWQIALFRRSAVNAYLLGDVLVDAGTPGMGQRLPGLLAGHAVRAHAITHAHPDHVGGSRAVCEALGVPFWAPAGEAPAVEAGRAVPSRRWIPPARLPSVPVARRLHEGDEVGGFRVVDAPGHSPGHVALWREAERLLVCGDAFFNLRSLRLEPGLREPPALLTLDPERNRRSMRRLAALEPRLAVFGHGPPVRDAAAALGALVARL